MAETRAIQSGLGLDSRPREIREITASSAWASHPFLNPAEGHLRPGMPPRAFQSSKKKEADLGLVLERESGAERKKPRASPEA